MLLNPSVVTEDEQRLYGSLLQLRRLFKGRFGDYVRTSDLKDEQAGNSQYNARLSELRLAMIAYERRCVDCLEAAEVKVRRLPPANGNNYYVVRPLADSTYYNKEDRKAKIDLEVQAKYGVHL
jgi:hypothetical protein